MKTSSTRKFYAILIIICMNISTILVFIDDITPINQIDDNDERIKSDAIKSSNGNFTVDRSGKTFTIITSTSQNCYINREQPGLNTQPSIFIPNYYISHAEMNFENITAINFTRNLEIDPSEIVYSSKEGPTYVYQKFSVELNQYVNNVSIFIQDICQLQPSPIFTDENSWEVAIVNCSNDPDGTPNINETEILGKLQLPHPTNLAAHWEVFDFKNVGNGPIFLNISKTNWTIENGIKKYWFAIRIKMPPNDENTGGGPKFLYFNPDGGGPANKGEGDTFIDSEVNYVNYTTNYIVANRTWNGNRRTKSTCRNPKNDL